ncbi:hypothetical protein SRB17_32780 [Streptomyces sp. RB17]|nr:hypothetical protein [Streptomyces sp. RB17]
MRHRALGEPPVRPPTRTRRMYGTAPRSGAGGPCPGPARRRTTALFGGAIGPGPHRRALAARTRARSRPAAPPPYGCVLPGLAARGGGMDRPACGTWTCGTHACTEPPCGTAAVRARSAGPCGAWCRWHGPIPCGMWTAAGVWHGWRHSSVLLPYGRGAPDPVVRGGGMVRSRMRDTWAPAGAWCGRSPLRGWAAALLGSAAVPVRRAQPCGAWHGLPPCGGLAPTRVRTSSPCGTGLPRGARSPMRASCVVRTADRRRSRCRTRVSRAVRGVGEVG